MAQSTNTSSSSPEGSVGDAPSLPSQFKLFAKFGDPKADGKFITLSQSDKWLKQAGVIDGKKITTTDTGIQFKKFKSQKLDFADWERCLDELVTAKKLDVQDIKNKLTHCGNPGTHVKSGSSGGGSGVYDRLTDTHRYTGTHKERFDDSGRGKGLEGRRQDSPGEGYVQGYRNKDTFDKAHQ